MVSWYRCASWVTTPTTSCSDSSVTSLMSAPPILTAPLVGSYILDTRWVMVVLPAPDGPTSAVSLPAGARKLTSVSASWAGPDRSATGSAIDSSDASETSDAAGYRKLT